MDVRSPNQSAWKNVNQSQRNEILGIYYRCQAAENMNDLLIIANQLAMPLETLKKRLREHAIQYPDFARDAKSAAFSENQTYYTDVIRIEEDNFVVASDFEIPDHNVELCQRILDVGELHNIKTLIIGGDLLASNQTGVNSHPNTTDNYKPTYREGLRQARELLLDFLSVYENIYVIRGNHDDMIARKTEGAVDYDLFFEAISDKLHFSRYSKMYVYGSRGPIKISHARKYSNLAIGVAQKLYDSDPEKPHVVMAHTHLAQRGWTADGLREVITLGCLRNPMKTEYIRINDNTFPQWNPGFLLVRNSFFYPLNLFGTNWNEVLKAA